MVFNSPAFLFMFLPAAFLLYVLIPGQRGRNILLTVLSLVFYAFGGLTQVPALLFAWLWNYAFGRLLARKGGRRKLWRALALGGNLALLGVYKYLGFLLEILGLGSLDPGLVPPMGVSFFTFHAVSYILDVYRGSAPAEKNPGRLFLYLAFFPRLLAGPIVRWRDAWPELSQRTLSPDDAAAGLRRFVRGLAKKLLLAESAAAIANGVYAMEPSSLSAGLAWLGAVSYCVQIYFDFSGYSDMAIGLGRLFGFRFPENFDYPYASLTVSEFWRRWHMTLNRWFTEYLYFPLGGSRRGDAVTVRNKLIVFFFTGLWHGAGWTFILWGLWHGLLVSLEGLGRKRLDALRKGAPGRAVLRFYTLLAVLVGFVMFRASSPSQGIAVLGRMFSFASGGIGAAVALRTLLTPARLAFLLLGALFSAPVVPALDRIVFRDHPSRREAVQNGLALLGLVLCVMAMAGGGFSPFIYQQF